MRLFKLTLGGLDEYAEGISENRAFVDRLVLCVVGC